jgi:hypothetical protein
MNSRCAAGFLLVVLSVPPRAGAQTLVGRVVEEGRETPVTGALVSLVDRDGEPGPRTITDSLGQFVLTPRRDGEYVVEVTRLGYETTRSPLFAMTVEGSVSLDLVMHPLPLGLGRARGVGGRRSGGVVEAVRTYADEPGKPLDRSAGARQDRSGGERR